MTALRAKLFKNGGSQAVRLPKECRFPDDEREVVVHREGRRPLLIGGAGAAAFGALLRRPYAVVTGLRDVGAVARRTVDG